MAGVVSVAPGVDRREVHSAYNFTYYRRNRSRLLQEHAERYERERERRQARAKKHWQANKHLLGPKRRNRERRARLLQQLRRSLDFYLLPWFIGGITPEEALEFWEGLNGATKRRPHRRAADAPVHPGQRVDAAP